MIAEEIELIGLESTNLLLYGIEDAYQIDNQNKNGVGITESSNCRIIRSNTIAYLDSIAQEDKDEYLDSIFNCFKYYATDKRTNDEFLSDKERQRNFKNFIEKNINNPIHIKSINKNYIIDKLGFEFSNNKAKFFFVYDGDYSKNPELNLIKFENNRLYLVLNFCIDISQDKNFDKNIGIEKYRSMKKKYYFIKKNKEIKYYNFNSEKDIDIKAIDAYLEKCKDYKEKKKFLSNKDVKKILKPDIGKEYTKKNKTYLTEYGKKHFEDKIKPILEKKDILCVEYVYYKIKGKIIFKNRYQIVTEEK